MKKIENWKALFHDKILERGKDLFDGGYIYDYESSDKGIRADVGQGSSYDVYISHKEGHISSMYCECPYARSGFNCKHMAALLYKFEEEVEQQDESSLIHPFKDQFKDKKYYFDINKAIAQERIMAADHEQALKLIADNKISKSDIGMKITGEDEKLLCGEFIIEDKVKNKVTIELARDHLEEIDCENCDYSSRYYYGYGYRRKKEKLCVHKIVGLLLLAEYIRRFNPGDYSNYDAVVFFEQFPLTAAETAELKKEVILEPHLEVDSYGLLELSFKIGDPKLYVVKDINEMSEIYENRGIMALGRKNRLDFSLVDFDEQSQKYYDFIHELIEENRIKADALSDQYYNYYSYTEHFTNDISLYGKRLDDFFELARDQRVCLTKRKKGHNEEIPLQFCEELPDLKLDITPVNVDDEFVGVNLKGKVPDFIEGNDYSYQLKNDKLTRFPKQSLAFLRRLPRNRYGNIDYVIGKDYLSRFYSQVLPILKENITIREKDKETYADQLPLKGLFNFYFDVRDGLICCLAEVTYEDQTYNLLKPIDNERQDHFTQQQVRKILADGLRMNAATSLFETDNEDDSISRVLENTVPALQKYGDVHSTAAFDRLRFKVAYKINVGVRIESDLLELNIQSDDIPLEELAEVINSYRLKKKYHKLRNGQLVNTEDQSIAELAMMLDSLDLPLKKLVEGKMNIPAYRALYLDSLMSENEELYEKRDERFKKLVDNIEKIDENTYALPVLKAELRPYQVEGFRWLKSLAAYSFGGILADEMGLGKTLQMIAVLKDYKDEHGSLNALIVCPSSLVYNWQSEVQRFAPDLRTLTITGNANYRQELIDDHDGYDILVTSYDLLRRDINRYEDNYFDFEILDEAQYIKTYNTANARSCKIIKAKNHFALTGTPIENNLSELWSIFDFLMPGFLYRYENFRQRFELPIISKEDEDASKRLRKMIAPFILRRKKADVLQDLPEKMEEFITVAFSEKQQRLYDSQVLKMQKKLEESSDASFRTNKIAILAELTKIRQICLDPSLVFDNYEGESAKREACLELIENAIAEGHKILLFSQFTSMLEILKKELNARNIAYYEITGQTKKEDRLKLVNDFNKDDTPLFLISLKAGGTGLNLTGADIVIHYDPWWNIAAQNQATDRAHRIGQEKIVTVYRIIAKGSIEEKIVELQNKKSELVESMLDSDSVSISSLSRDELLDILS